MYIYNDVGIRSIWMVGKWCRMSGVVRWTMGGGHVEGRKWGREDRNGGLSAFQLVNVNKLKMLPGSDVLMTHTSLQSLKLAETFYDLINMFTRLSTSHLLQLRIETRCCFQLYSTQHVCTRRRRFSVFTTRICCLPFLFIFKLKCFRVDTDWKPSHRTTSFLRDEKMESCDPLFCSLSNKQHLKLKITLSLRTRRTAGQRFKWAPVSSAFRIVHVASFADAFWERLY